MSTFEKVKNLWPGYRWPLHLHAWDRAFLVVMALFFFGLGLFQVRSVCLYAAQSADKGAVGGFILACCALAGVLGFGYGNAVWLLNRWGSLRLFEEAMRQPAAVRGSARFHDHIVLLIPSYREDPGDVRRAVLSAALQNHSRLDIVVLLDDGNAEAERVLQSELDGVTKFLRELPANPVPAIEAERARCYASPSSAQRDFAVTILDPVIAHWHNHLNRDCHLLEAIRNRDIRIFSRKRYANLSNRPTKAMNINAFLSLIGGRYEEGEKNGKLVLIPSTSKAPIWDLPEPELISVLDADTVIRFDYVERLLPKLHEPGGDRIGAVYAMATGHPSIRGRLHHVAGVQTAVLAATLHYGALWFDAGYWSGNNGLLRWAALKDIAQWTEHNGLRVPVYLPDLPSEDTISTVWMLQNGWKSKGVLAPLVHTEIPDTFAKLLIQRKRWTSSGYHGIPGVLQHWRRNWTQPRASIELFIRLSYLLSVGPVSCVVLLALLSMLPVNMGVEAVWFCGLLYYISLAMDLIRIGQPWHSIWRVAALNISLLPVAVLSLFTMANDFLTGRKRAFDRTPRRGETTSLSVQYRIVATLMVMAVFWRALPSRMWSLADAAPALINVGLLLAGWYLARGGPIPIEGAAFTDPRNC